MLSKSLVFKFESEAFYIVRKLRVIPMVRKKRWGEKDKKAPFDIIKKRFANCIKNQKEVNLMKGTNSLAHTKRDHKYLEPQR